MDAENITVTVTFDGDASPPIEECRFCDSDRLAVQAVTFDIPGPIGTAEIALCSDCAQRARDGYTAEVMDGLADESKN